MCSKKIIIPALFTLMLVVPAYAGRNKAQPLVIGGVTYGVTEGNFVGDWFDFYERGASYMDGALVAMDIGDEELKKRAAELGMADLKEAISVRDGDQRRAITYGLHTIDYFARREMGVGYFVLGNCPEAVRELEASLSRVESSKAQYFLDKARKCIIDTQGGDARAPEIFVEALPERTAEQYISLKIRATDDGFISSLLIDYEEESIPLSQKSVEIERSVRLIEGENEIDIAAVDLEGNTSVRTVKVLCDNTGPSVTIEESKPAVEAGSLSIRGWVTDSGGVKTLKLGDLDLKPGADGSFNATVKTDENGKVVFEAEDELGNKNSGEVGIETKGDDQGRYYRSTFAGLFGQVGARGLNPLSGTAIGPIPARWVIGAVQVQPAKGPEIKIKGLTQTQDAYFESFYLQGEASDPSGVQMLVVGRQNLITKPGQKVFFNYLRSLRVGSNSITIVGKNGLGVASSANIKVVRKMQTVKTVGSRMSVSMLPFYLKGTVDKGSVAHADLLKFLKGSGRFRMIDRSQIDRVAQEMQLSQAKLTDQASAVQLGKRVNAETVLLGFVNEKPGSIEVYGRVVNVETGEILTEKDAYSRQPTISLTMLLSLMKGLSAQLHNQFPMVEGQVISFDGNNIQSKLISGANLKPGTKLIVFREKPVYHPQTKMPLGNQTEPITEVRVAKASGGSASGVIINSRDAGKVGKTDKVITK